MNLEDKIAEELSRQMAQEIDNELMADMLVALGWTKVTYRYHHNKAFYDMIKEWIEKNCNGTYKRLGDHWLFTDQGDAVNFTLRWKE